MNEEQRQQLLGVALSDKNSVMYKGMMKVLEDCEAAERRSKQNSEYVVIPFFLDDQTILALESQFNISIKIRGGINRANATTRVSGMVFLLESAMLEHASGCARNILLVDGDVMSVAALGIEGKIVERTHATPRLATGYFLEDEQLRRYITARSGQVNSVADTISREQVLGGGDHFWPMIRVDGPKVHSIVVNHFKTPIGPKQLAWLAYKRGGVVFGCIPFQFDMLTKDKGKLDCFPGEFYIDRKSDVITLIPESDATMSVSHPYSSWLEIVTNNVIAVAGKEFLCEKYNKVKGVLYYTLTILGQDYHAPETLRTYYFDPASVGVTELRFPRVKLSSEGVPVGWERGRVRILTARQEKVMSRLMCSANEVVKPSEAFTALMDYNNTVVSSLDSVSVAQRMDESEEGDVALALALHVNWTRHAAKGTLNTLLNAIKLRYSVKDAALYKFAFIALSAWWSKPRIKDSLDEDELPVAKVVDWCGNDFSVVMKDADPWIEIAQLTGSVDDSNSRCYPWFPIPPGGGGATWYSNILQRARAAVQSKIVSDDCCDDKRSTSETVISSDIIRFPKVGTWQSKSISEPNVSVLDQSEVFVARQIHELTVVKQLLKKKLVMDQGAMNEHVPDREMLIRQPFDTTVLPEMPVPDIDITSSINDDLLMCNRGPFDRDVVTTGYRISEIDIDKHGDGNYSINDAKREVPKSRWVRYPKVDAGVEGKRVSSSMALMGALYKRNIGIPANRGTVDLQYVPAMAVEKVIQVCYREDWQEILQKHLNKGLWEPNEEDIEDFVANIDEKKVRGLLEEFFTEGEVSLDRWLLMAKGKIKTSRDVDGANKVDHSQTIMYLENSSTNAMYSAMTRRFKECIDECMRPEVSLNPQRSDEEHEIWYNSTESHRKSFQNTFSYSADIKTYDRAQEHVALRTDIEFYRRHGLSRDRLKIWEQTHGPKRAIAMMYGIVLTMTLGGVSGLWKTLLRNGLVNLAALVVSTNVSRSDIVMLDIKGDDVDAEFARPVMVETAVERMSLTFNLSAKFFTSDVRYMCKMFRIKIHGRWYFVADPWARVQSLCTPLWVGNKEENLDERWISLKSDLRHYDNGILVDAVAEAAQQYYGTERPLYGMARGLANVAACKLKYINFFRQPVMVS